MLSTNGQPQHDTLDGSRPDFLHSPLNDYLWPPDERQLHRVKAVVPGLNSSGPLYDGHAEGQSDFPGTVRICPQSTPKSTIEFLTEIRANRELRLLEMSGEYRTGLNITLRHVSPPKLYPALATMNTVRKVTNRDGKLTVELIGSDSRSA